MAKRKPPSGGLSVEELRAKAKARKGKSLTKAHKAAISDGLKKHHLKKRMAKRLIKRYGKSPQAR